MKRILLAVTLIAANLGTGVAQKARRRETPKGMAVAFFDNTRLQNPAGKANLDNFQFYVKLIQEIIKQDFPGIEFRIVGRGEFVRLPDGTGLNVQNIQPELGFVLSARGKKRRMLKGVQSDADFACAAAAYFKKSSSACPK